MWKSALLPVFSLLVSSYAQNVIDLTGPGWTLHSSNGSISVPATLPSQQYVDLFNAGVIGDPLYGLNNTDQSWVTLQNWTYTSGPLNQLSHGAGYSSASTYLVFQGLDTFTHIELCGQAVGDTNNMYRQYIFDVTNILKACRGAPHMSLNFGSAVNITHEIGAGPDADALDNTADGCTDDAGAEFSCKAYARKEQNDFGWDWSPSLAPAGPWRPFYAIEIGQKQIYVNNALIDIYRKGQMNNIPPDQSQPWIFNASLDHIGTLPKGSVMKLTLTDSSGRNVLSQPLTGIHSSANSITGSTTIDPSKVQLWWPNGMGAQVLYNATVDIIDSHGSLISTTDRRVGFRTILLNLGPITNSQLAQGIAPGSNWHFEINGHEFYAKGSNFVPPDVFWPRVNDTKITKLFELATGAGMNMFRVWSSGTYLDDWIYDLADEMGLLLWSEFQFTDAEYPNSTVYLKNYEAEAYYNVRRVNNHPSLALWVGGNELESIMLAYFFDPTSPEPIMQQYQQIFEELLIKCVYANTRSISYIPSSTYNGYLSLDFKSVRPQTPRYDNTSGPNYIYSDTDAYNYDAPTLFAMDTYPIGRFADEFGFHSMPSMQSWQQEAAPDQLYYPSDTVINHNRHYPFGASGSNTDLSLAGIEEMTQAVQMYLPTPDLKDPLANFSAWCWSTQVVQADDIAHQIAFYRRGSGMPERQLGSLYWMFSDLWDAPTWASVEASNRQKVLYYSAKDIYQPVIVATYYNTSTSDMQVWATSDLWSSVSGTLTYSWVDWNGQPLQVKTPSAPGYSNSDNSGSTTKPIPFTIGAINSTQLLHIPDLNSTLASSKVKQTNALLMLSVTAHSGGKTYTHSSVFHPAPLAAASIPNPKLHLTHHGTTLTVTSTSAVAAWVWLDYTTNAVQGYWSENGFWLNKGESKTVTFTVWDDWSDGKWLETVYVQSIYDMTQS